ncbi:hypothetical protein GCM10010442_33770 [Kitasatospora kifunensis]
MSGALAAGTAYAADAPQQRDANGNLTNSVTSDSPGSTCVTGTEPNCTTTTQVVPMIDPVVAVVAAMFPVALGAAVLYRRRTKDSESGRPMMSGTG